MRSATAAAPVLQFTLDGEAVPVMPRRRGHRPGGPPLTSMPRQAEFDAYDRAHPEVYRAFCLMAWRHLSGGAYRLSAVPLLEDIRRSRHGGTVKEDGYKVTNTWAPYYARKIIAEHPIFAGYFTLKPLRAA